MTDKNQRAASTRDAARSLRRKPTLARTEARLAYWLLGPTVLIVLAIVIVPVLTNVFLSFKEVQLRDLRGGNLFNFDLTLKNFIKVFNDREFFDVLRASVVYATGGTLLSLVLGLLAALLVNVRFPLRNLVRGVFLFPYIAPVVSVTYVWVLMLGTRGVLNSLVKSLGLSAGPIPFTSSWPEALVVVVIFEGWRYFPFAFLFILARLQAIPKELYEAAVVDGANPWRKFIHVTLPQLRTVLATLILLRFIWTFNKFDDVFLLTGGAARTRVLPVKVYDYLFGRFNIGEAAATAMVLFGVLGLFLLIYFRFIAAKEDAV